MVEKQREVDLENVCEEFHFNTKNTNELYFFSATALLKMDYNDSNSSLETVYKFLNPLADLPNFG